MTQVILVDKNDNQIGIADKLKAHKDNLCHRAFSIILTREKNQQTEFLLQQRQKHKYHCPELWSNACCSHPEPNTDTLESAHIRLKFEMNIECKLTPIGHLYYQSKLSNGLFEHEFDHIFHGIYDHDSCAFNPNEVADIKWMNLEELKLKVRQRPDEFTPWLPLLLDKINL